jgi:signal transduction histidine kinase
MAARQSLQLSHTCIDDIPNVWADPRLLTQVVSNLLTNALNYTQPGGKIHLQVSHEMQDGNQWVVIRVIDTGVGIQPEESPNLFTRFFRGSASELTGASGTGLGLAISKELSERMGGSITMESTPGKGSTFSVWLKAVL